MNMGCFDGKEWKATGDDFSALDPNTNKVSVSGKFASLDDYERCIHN